MNVTMLIDADGGDDILYFPVKIAIHRIGGVAAAARRLGVNRVLVQQWCERTNSPDKATLQALSQASGVSLMSFERYHTRLQVRKVQRMQRAA